MSNKYNWFNTENEELSKWERVCPVGEYRVLRPCDLPTSAFSVGLTEKCDSVVVVASGSAGNTWFMANFARVEESHYVIDQMPAAIVFKGAEPLPSGTLRQHGDWDGRTEAPPAQFWSNLSSSQLPTLYPYSQIPLKAAGTLEDLGINSHTRAMEVVFKKMQCFIEQGDAAK